MIEGENDEKERWYHRHDPISNLSLHPSLYLRLEMLILYCELWFVLWLKTNDVIFVVRKSKFQNSYDHRTVCHNKT